MCAFITFTSCKKESDNASVNNTQDQTTQKLIEFKNKLNSKDVNSISIENATWYLEGLLNYEKANNEHNMADLTYNYDTISYIVTSETFSYEQLETVYLNLNKILNHYIQLAPNAKYDLIDLSIVKASNEVKVIMISSAGVVAGKYQYQIFGSTDYWVWGWNLGKCGSYCGNNTGADAADQLKYRFNNPLNKPYIPGYYTNVEMKTIRFDTYPDQNYSGTFNHYMMFWASGPGSGPGSYAPCISPDELNYYLSKFDYIKDLNCPTGKKFKSANVIEDISCGLDYWDRAHDYQLYYGTFVSGAIMD